MAQWHKVSVFRAHLGYRARFTTTAFVFAEDAMGVIKRYKRMSGVKRNIGRDTMPNISPLSEPEARELEKRIIKEGIIPLREAKLTWYYDRLI